jgi:lysophospholipase L1-like esterase
LLAAGTVLLTSVAALGLLRWLAPQLLGVPVDLQLVQASKTVPPFFEGIFREQDYAATGILLNDPYTNIRFKPLQPEDNGTGPHDILGFRNTGVPNHADVVVLGDSQTYGLGEPFTASWPSQMSSLLQQEDTSVYSMAVGGWGAVQYLDMFAKAARLGPQTVITAFYTGNDPLETFSTAYGNEHWAMLRIDPELDKTDAPAVGSMLSVEDSWPVKFEDGVRIVFTPKGRLAANNTDYPAVRAGYAIMAEVARRITRLARQHHITAVFTIIPTRELVYAKKVASESLSPPEIYQQLVRMEQANIEELADLVRVIPGARYVDLTRPLQSAAMSDAPLYPRQWDGHPGKEGYGVIASTLAAAINLADKQPAGN